MKKITSILLSIIMIYSVCFPITAFAAALPTVGISSLSVKENTVTVKWKRNLKSWAIKSNIQPTVSLKRIKNPLRLKKQKQLLRKFQI